MIEMEKGSEQFLCRLSEGADLAPGLTFDEKKHLYMMNERPLYSVTQVLSLGGVSSFLGGNSNAESVLLGTMVHKYLEAVIRDDGEGMVRWEKELTPEWVECALSVLTQIQDTYRVTIVSPEVRLAYEPIQLAGTLDLVGTLDRKLVVMDFKTGGSYPQYELQLGGYAALLSYAHGVAAHAVKTACVYLKPGKPVFVEFHDTVGAMNTFLNVLKVAEWKLAKGVTM